MLYSASTTLTFSLSAYLSLFRPLSLSPSLYLSLFLFFFLSLSQVVILIDQIIWTNNATKAILDFEGRACPEGDIINSGGDSQAIKTFLELSLRQIDAMVILVRTPLDKQQRTLLGALLTIDVHYRDVTRTLIAKEVNSLSNFEWSKQLRFYWDAKEDDVHIKQINSTFTYSYEYLGNSPRLVVTPLTDTCYIALTSALYMGLGGALSGPSGSGKNIL